LANLASVGRHHGPAPLAHDDQALSEPASERPPGL